MHPEIVIVCTYRQGDGVSTIPDNPDTLTRQSAAMDNDPRDLLHGPITNTNINFGTYYMHNLSKMNI